MNKFNHLNIFIQGNKPLFLTNDVSLATIVGKMVDYIDNLIDRESILESSFKTVKTETNTSITDLNNAISLFVSEQTSNYSSFETEVINNLEQYKNETNTEITNKSNEVDNALNNIDLTDSVSSYFTSQLNTDYFTNLYNNIKALAYILTYYGPTPPTITVSGSYWYNTTTNKLYYGTTSASQEVVLSPNSYYYYGGKLYIPIKENNVYVLREVNTNG